MRVLLLVQREARDSSTCWVIDAMDEYSMDEWGGMPPVMQKKVDDDPQNVRSLWVEIPDNGLEKAFEVPKVTGIVA